MSDEGKVFLAEFYPEGRTGFTPPRTVLLGIFTDILLAEEYVLQEYTKVAEIFWNGIDVRWVDRPKGRFLLSGDGTFTFARIREIGLDSPVDKFLSVW